MKLYETTAYKGARLEGYGPLAALDIARESKLTDDQVSVLATLNERGRWFHPLWLIEDLPTTVDALDLLVSKGLATKDDQGVYRPVRFA